MRVKELLRAVRGSFREVWRQGMGKAGLTLIMIILAVSIYAWVTMPPDFVSLWNDARNWEENPILAPPSWVRLFGTPVAPSYTEVLSAPTRTGLSYGFFSQEYSIDYELEEEAFPRNIIISIRDYRPIIDPRTDRVVQLRLIVTVDRPDGITAMLYDGTLATAEEITGEEPLRIRVDRVLAARVLTGLLAEKYGVRLDPNVVQQDIARYIFGRPAGGTLEPLLGSYSIRLAVYYIAEPSFAEEAIREGSGVREVKFTVVGNAFGSMGTDMLGRDIAMGLFYGFPVALLVGFFAAVSSVLIGLVAGVVSGFYGGFVDEFIQRFVDVLGNIPLLPILVLVAAAIQDIIFDPWRRLLVIITFLIIFSWGSLAIIVRSMTLSIKSEIYVEAAKAVGASNFRIIFRHIMPQIIPYAMASLVFSVPNAILIEAGISVLGIWHGLPTWGRMLAEARESLRYDVWWWIFPPGMLIALTSLAFVMLGMAIETVVEPRLRRR